VSVTDSFSSGMAGVRTSRMVPGLGVMAGTPELFTLLSLPRSRLRLTELPQSMVTQDSWRLNMDPASPRGSTPRDSRKLHFLRCEMVPLLVAALPCAT
jgi:hypothetical protein